MRLMFYYVRGAASRILRDIHRIATSRCELTHRPLHRPLKFTSENRDTSERTRHGMHRPLLLRSSPPPPLPPTRPIRTMHPAAEHSAYAYARYSCAEFYASSRVRAVIRPIVTRKRYSFREIAVPFPKRGGSYFGIHIGFRAVLRFSRRRVFDNCTERHVDKGDTLRKLKRANATKRFSPAELPSP